MDSAGNVYVADTINSAIREITPAGVVTTLASPLSGAGFDSPYGVAVDGAGNIYVADTYNSVIREITPVFGATKWQVTTIAGLVGQAGSSDGTNSEARFNYPYDVAVDSAGNL